MKNDPSSGNSFPSIWPCTVCSEESVWNLDKCPVCGHLSIVKKAYQSGAWEKVTAECNKVLEASPGTISANLLISLARDYQVADILARAEDCCSKKEWAIASTLCNQAIGILPGNIAASELLKKLHGLYAKSVVDRAQECLGRGEFEEALTLCNSLEVHYNTKFERCGKLRHDICVTYIARSEAAMSASEWQKAKDFAQKALDVEPDNPVAERIRTESADKLQLKTLASKALEAYSRRDLDGCKKACDALLSYQQSCGGHVEFTDASGNVIDFKNLHWKLNNEIAIQREAERQQLAEQARVRKAIIMVRFFKTTVTCVIIALVLLGVGHWRKVRFKKGVQAFESAMQIHAYDEARALAPPVADKYKPASSLLAYFKSKESFESVLSAVNSSLLRQYGPQQWANLQSQKQAADAGVGNPDRGIDAYQRAMTLLAECQTLADAGEKARKDKEASEKALAAERARSEQARIKAAENAEDVKLIARIKNDLEILIASIRAETAMLPKPNESMVCTPAELMDAANRNIPEAQILIGIDSLFGFKRFNKDRDEASALFRKAAEQGHPFGQYQLGMIFSGDHDDISAAKWFRKAADKGLMEAQSFLGIIYWEGLGVNKDASEAVKWWRKAAEQGYTTAENNLGQCFLTGKGVTKNKQEGIKWLRRAAAKGYGNATAALAELQEEPSMTEQSPNTKEDALAQNNLGFSYLTGDGVRKDPVEAAKWLSRAARNGSPNAQCTLGIMYNQGLGVEKDDAMAARWFRRSADQGFAAAQLNLGTRYINGTGVPRNEAEGFMWIRRAAKQGDEDAIRILKDNNISL